MSDTVIKTASIIKSFADIERERMDAYRRFVKVPVPATSSVILGLIDECRRTMNTLNDRTNSIKASYAALGEIPATLKAASLAQQKSFQESNQALSALIRQVVQQHDLSKTAIEKAIENSGFNRFSQMSLMAYEMQKVSLLSQTLAQRIDWIKIHDGRVYDGMQVRTVRNCFDAYSRKHAALFASGDSAENVVTVLEPELSRVSILDYHNTVESIEMLSPGVDTPEIIEIRNDLRERQSIEFGSELQVLLYELNPEFCDLWNGAEEAFQSGHKDHQRHWSISIRELLDYVLRALAPDEEVKRWTSDPHDYHDGEPTRGCRVRYICRGMLRDGRKAFARLVESDIKCFIAVIDLLQGGTHAVPSALSHADIAIIKIKVESVLTFLLKIAKHAE